LIGLICVGKLREPWAREAAAAMLEKVRHYEKAEMIETPKCPTPDGEGKAILARSEAFDALIAFDPEGDKLTSEGFAALIEKCRTSGKSRIAFAVGGASGLSDEVTQKASRRLSFSDMVFSHELFRVMALEQIYRALTILAGAPYHK